MSSNLSFIILAAGEGKRLKSSLPKPLVEVSGLAMVDYSINAVLNFTKKIDISTGSLTTVIGHQRELLISHLEKFNGQTLPIDSAVQEEQLGTGHAVKCAFEGVDKLKESSYVAVLCADTPLIRESVFVRLWEEIKSNDLDGAVAAFETLNPYGYGRIINHDNGLTIIEEKDATNEQRLVTRVNSGVYIFKTEILLDRLSNLNNDNESGEFYLTDFFNAKTKTKSVLFDNENMFLGVNNLNQLELATTLVNDEVLNRHMENGVRFMQKNSCFIDYDVKIGEGSVIYPNVSVLGKSCIGEKAIIKNGCILENARIENGVELKPYTCIEDSVIRNHAVIGPFARIRPHCDIGENCKIGNFVETKKARLDKGAKVSHLSYVGDAEIGENSNIGCGFITCNYDGANKHLTKIGKNCFIGSDSQMIAPVNIGDGCYVASGSTINQDLPEGSFGIARARQVIKEGLAKRFIKTKK